MPTRELAEQVYGNLKELTVYCDDQVHFVNLAADIPMGAQIPMLAEVPDIIVSTPSKVLTHLVAGNLNVQTSLESLVIDEADLILSFGYEEDIQKLLTFLSPLHQSYLMSATLTAVCFIIYSGNECFHFQK